MGVGYGNAVFGNQHFVVVRLDDEPMFWLSRVSVVRRLFRRCPY